MTTRQRLQAEAKQTATDLRKIAQFLESASISTRPTIEIFAVIEFTFGQLSALSDKINDRFEPLFETQEEVLCFRRQDVEEILRNAEGKTA